MIDLELSCTCGAVAGRLARIAPAAGTHLVCYCADCRAFARHLGHDEVLGPAGGTRLFQTTTDRVELAQGASELRCLRMTRRGPLRWYAGCCGTPLANTAPRAGIPFGGVAVAALGGEVEAALGPVVAHVHTASALPGGKAPRSDTGLMRVVGRFARLTLEGRMTGAHRRAPFFDAEGQPVAEVHLLTAEERRSAYR